jgi:hypothetical protein
MLQFGAFRPQNMQGTLGVKTYKNHLYDFTKIVTFVICVLFHNRILIFLTPKGPNSQIGFFEILGRLI